MEGSLNRGLIEVVVRATSEGWESHFIPEEWAEIGQMIASRRGNVSITRPRVRAKYVRHLHVEAGIDIGSCFNNIFPQIAIPILTGNGWEILWRGKSQSFIQKLIIAAFLGPLVDVSHESLVQPKDTIKVIQCRYGGGYFKVVSS